jgi:O-acetyl-ADP-ribose deacetylase (regulator of RNase III)
MKPNTLTELEKWMTDNCCNGSYGIGERTVYDGFVLDKSDDGFVWYYTERGRREDLNYFETEEEAVAFALNWMTHDIYYRNRLSESKSSLLRELGENENENKKTMKIEFIKGDITKMKTDAIVNAANSSLLGGGGVDGAIHRAGGKAILDECIAIRNRQGGCKVGEAVITTGGNLAAKKVIHTVGPRWNNGQSDEETKLKDCYENSLKLAEANGIETIAFPNISTGVYRFPKKRAAEIAIKTVQNYQSERIKTVIFVCFDDENYDLYVKGLLNF